MTIGQYTRLVNMGVIKDLDEFQRENKVHRTDIMDMDFRAVLSQWLIWQGIRGYNTSILDIVDIFRPEHTSCKYCGKG